MKSLDFLKEDIVTDAQDMQLDHEVQMARKDCYTAADNAIALHRLLRNISEQQGLEGWVAAKITLASDYLNTVREYLEYQLMTGSPMQEPISVTAVAESKLNEVDPRNFDSDVDYYAARNAPPKRRSAPSDYPFSKEEDDDYFREIFRKKREAKAKESGVTEGGREMTGTPRDRFISTMTPRMDNDALMQKVAKVVNSPEFNEDTILKIVDAGNTVTHPVARYIQKEFEELQYDLPRSYEDYPERVAEKLLSMLIDRTKQGVTESNDYSAVTNAITRRILQQHPQVLAKYGPEVVGLAIDEIAEFVGNVDEIGSSDVSGWVSQVIRSLGRFAPVRNSGVAEGKLDEKSMSQAQFRTMAAVAHNPKFAKKIGISQKVGREFHQADKGANYKKLPKKVNELDMYGKAPTKNSNDWSQATVKYADPATAANKPTAADWAKNSADFDKKYPTPQAYNQRQIELYNKKYPGVPAPTDLTGDSEENRQAQLKALQTPGVKEARIDFAKKLQKNIGKSNTSRAKSKQDVENWTKDLSKDQLDKLAGPRYKKDVTVKEMSSGSVATVVNPTPKNKAKTGTLFGGTYKQKRAK